MIDHRPSRRGRGAPSNPAGRFEHLRHEAFDDGWGTADEPLPSLPTTVTADPARRVISTNRSWDLGFDRSINPYKGCEHGCIYCYARPTHGYLGLSAGLDFESKLLFKAEAARLLRQELARPGYRCDVILLGANTDAYQPVERRLQITRQILEVLSELEHPVAIVTKSNLVLRDLDLLADLARRDLVRVTLSITTLDRALARRMEPRAATPERRLDALRALGRAGVPTAVLAAPMIPALNDHELETILARAAAAGAREAGYVLLRLPHELKTLFAEWLELHFPRRAKRVLALIRQTRAGALDQSAFGLRMRGSGPYAELLARRFAVACRRHGLDRPAATLDRTRFRPSSGGQLALF